MDDPFELPVSHNGEEIMFPAELKQMGYTHRIVVDVCSTEVSFEPDDELNYGALVEKRRLNAVLNALLRPEQNEQEACTGIASKFLRLVLHRLF